MTIIGEWILTVVFFVSSRRRHTRYIGDWSSDVCSSDLLGLARAVLWCSLAPRERRFLPRRSKRGKLALTNAAEHRERPRARCADVCSPASSAAQVSQAAGCAGGHPVRPVHSLRSISRRPEDS